MALSFTAILSFAKISRKKVKSVRAVLISKYVKTFSEKKFVIEREEKINKFTPIKRVRKYFSIKLSAYELFKISFLKYKHLNLGDSQ